MAKYDEYQSEWMDCKDYKELLNEGIEAEKPGYYCLRCGVELNTPKERKYGLCEQHFEIAVRGGKVIILKGR